MSLPDGLAVLTTPWLPSPWTLARFDAEGTVPTSLGAWLREHQIYSQGRDYTGFADYDSDRSINSRLLRHWEGDTSDRSPWTTLTGWVLLDAQHHPVGIVLWEHGGAEVTWVPEIPEHPRKHPRQELAVADIGGVGMFLHAQHRGQGLMRRIMRQAVRPMLRGHRNAIVHSLPEPGMKVLPYVCAQGATVNLLKEWRGGWILGEDFSWCLRRRRDMWDQATHWRLDEPLASVRALAPVRKPRASRRP